jgi:hypothetical protein
MIDETRMHLYLTALGFKADFLDEWFIDCSEVLQGFHERIEKIEKVVWKNRDVLFTAFDFSRRSFKVQIYEDLRFKHRNENLNTLLIDNEWKAWNLKKEIDATNKLIHEGYLDFIE